MTFSEHLDNSRAMTLPQMDNLLRTLGRDERFAAVVGWLERNREAFVKAGSRQDLAADHGKLAHAQGSVHALHVLTAQLANLFTTPPTGGPPQTPPEE